MRGTWFPSSPEGRAALYQKVGLITQEERDTGLEASDPEGAWDEPGEQWRLFDDLLQALNHNAMHGSRTVDHYQNRSPRCRILGCVEDRVSTDSEELLGLLVRPIAIDLLEPQS